MPTCNSGSNSGSKGGGAKGSSTTMKKTETKPKTMRELQIESLERATKGKAIRPGDIKTGDVIEGLQYSFRDGVEAADVKRSAWRGEYAGADSAFRVVNIKKTPTSIEITAETLGGTPITAKKKFKLSDDI